MIPYARHRSATFRPASPSLTIARICSSVNLLRFIGPPLNGGPHLTRGGSEGAGQRRSPPPSRAASIAPARRRFLSIRLAVNSPGEVPDSRQHASDHRGPGPLPHGFCPPAPSRLETEVWREMTADPGWIPLLRRLLRSLARTGTVCQCVCRDCHW